MKKLLVIALGLIAIASSCFADTSSELNDFFSKPRKTAAGNASINALIKDGLTGSDSKRKEIRGIMVGRASTWAAEIKVIASKAGDTPAEKTLVAEMKRAYVGLLAAASEPIKADEAMRGLVSLRARVPNVVKGGSSLDW